MTVGFPEEEEEEEGAAVADAASLYGDNKASVVAELNKIRREE
jgi:hypothetical protein